MCVCGPVLVLLLVLDTYYNSHPTGLLTLYVPSSSSVTCHIQPTVMMVVVVRVLSFTLNTILTSCGQKPAFMRAFCGQHHQFWFHFYFLVLAARSLGKLQHTFCAHVVLVDWLTVCLRRLLCLICIQGPFTAPVVHDDCVS